MKKIYKPTNKEKEIIIHALGLNKSKTSYRNFYAAGEGHLLNKKLYNLVKHKLMIKRKDPFNDFGGVLYHVTELGKKNLK